MPRVTCFAHQASVAAYLDDLLQRIRYGFQRVEPLLPKELQALMAHRLHQNLAVLQSPP